MKQFSILFSLTLLLILAQSSGVYAKGEDLLPKKTNDHLPKDKNVVVLKVINVEEKSADIKKAGSFARTSYSLQQPIQKDSVELPFRKY